MSEYNIQMNKYNALNAEYDQLYPATKIKNVDGLGTALQNKADLGADGKVPAEQVDAYSQSDSISAETRTALSLPETATPDAALAEIARQLSERTTLRWGNAAPASNFAAQDLAIDGLQNYDFVLIDYQSANYGSTGGCAICSTRIGAAGVLDCYKYGKYWFDVSRNFRIVENGISFSDCYIYGIDDGGNKLAETNNSYSIPMNIYGLMA